MIKSWKRKNTHKAAVKFYSMIKLFAKQLAVSYFIYNFTIESVKPKMYLNLVEENTNKNNDNNIFKYPRKMFLFEKCFLREVNKLELLHTAAVNEVPV